MKSAAQSLGQGGEAQARGDPSKGSIHWVAPRGRRSGRNSGCRASRSVAPSRTCAACWSSVRQTLDVVRTNVPITSVC
ncbi:hypothetical protein E6W36_00230 [Hankyongella ginsenosidimutans]|uniref:Uncharacterized protein n=1 Tax=Hankyongella ginsenosidimutans TaxID=1763828 RepID=A0A4D7CAW9_9SPHN|nr:hypothetical protein [Hankyongella ginsenosidimutans]QCI78626.1 hypothetical protein E6W36_00230 [Hankyongella ginsenosidimutans]